MINLRFILFFIFFFLISGLSYYYIGRKILSPLRIRSYLKKTIWILLLLLFFMPFDTFLMRLLDYNPIWRSQFTWVAYIGLGFFSILIVFFLFSDSLRIFNVIAKKFAGMYKKNTAYMEPSVHTKSRRRFIKNFVNIAAGGIAGSMTGLGIYHARNNIQIKKIDVPISKLCHDLDGLRIIQITDLHVGLTIGYDFVKKVVEKVNSIGPDLVVITGDLVDDTVVNLKNDVSPLMDIAAPHGTYFVTGNHEYYSGAEDWLDEIKRLGITVLLNEHRLFQFKSGNMILAGVSDYSGGQFLKNHRTDAEKSISGAGPANVKILLAHQPKSIFAASKAGFDLQISGHTHGGQYFPFNYLVRLFQPYVSGLHKHNGTWIYISDGTGYWGPPVRFGVPPEITEITLVCQK